MILNHARDKYKLVKCAVRWACEIKQNENLPDPVSTLVSRALREILSGQVGVEEIEKLPELSQSSFGQTLPSPELKPEKDGKAA